jgi:hypothetical protein
MRTSPDLTSVLHQVTDAVELLPCGAEHSCAARLRRDSFALQERAVRAGVPARELRAEAEQLLERIESYLQTVAPEASAATSAPRRPPIPEAAAGR